VAFDDGEYPRYVPAAERRRRLARALRELVRRGVCPEPVRVDGRRIATTFWGRAWCDHIESHADLATRLPRGRTYLRTGAVLDLRITTGEVRALVCGADEYDTRVRIAPLPRERWDAVRRACTGRIANLVDLLAGKLSDAVMEVLSEREDGLFPRTDELHMSCSCPDDAWLCKHLAAVLYGIGARLDAAPELLFVLRGVDAEELVSAAGHAASAVAAAGTQAAGPAFRTDELAEIFGIELEAGFAPALPSDPRTGTQTKTKTTKKKKKRAAPPSPSGRGAQRLVTRRRS
jgi:uncharacterized Zn finger protein